MTLRFDDPSLDVPVRAPPPVMRASAETVGTARHILGLAYDPGDKTDAEVHREVVANQMGGAATANKSPAYLSAAFQVMADMKLAHSIGLRADTGDDAALRAARARAEVSRDVYLLELQDAWRGPEGRRRDTDTSASPRSYEENCVFQSHSWKGEEAARAAVAKFRASGGATA